MVPELVIKSSAFLPGADGGGCGGIDALDAQPQGYPNDDGSRRELPVEAGRVIAAGLGTNSAGS
jgi:hypothetical protein